MPACDASQVALREKGCDGHGRRVRSFRARAPAHYTILPGMVFLCPPFLSPSLVKPYFSSRKERFHAFCKDNLAPGLYADRVARRHRAHRDSGRHALPGFRRCPREGAAGKLPVECTAAWTGYSALYPGLRRDLSPRAVPRLLRLLVRA